MTAPGTLLPPKTLEGWYVLHQVFRLDRRALEDEEEGRARLGAELAGLFAEWADLGDEGWSGLYRLVGGGADLLALHFRVGLEELGRAEATLRRGLAGRLLTLEHDFLSVVELGLYRLTAQLASRLGEGESEDELRRRLEEAGKAQRSTAFVQRRLYPRQPEEMPYLCFYPMNKRRDGSHNWYRLGLEERSALMDDHGKVGRRYADRISQIISGSVGLDDWEWGVTLFGRNPLAFKDVVTEMRYDEASALYAEFGEFLVGVRLSDEAIRLLEV